MKLNPKVYQQLTNEPFETQEVNNQKIEFHYMNDTPFLFQFASRGRFAVWTSNGIGYRVLIEKSYYEAMKPFYEPEVNKIWLDFLTNVGEMSKKINRLFIIPTLILYVAVAAIATWLFPDMMWQVLLVMLILVVLSNMIQGRIVNGKVREANKKAQDEIRATMGVENFENLIKAQEEHYQAYFKFEEEPQPEITEETPNEEEPSNNEEESQEGENDDRNESH